MNFSILVKRAILAVRFASSGRSINFSSTFVLNSSQFTPFRFQEAARGRTGWYLIQWLIVVEIGRWSESPIGSSTCQVAFLVQRLPHTERSAMSAAMSGDSAVPGRRTVVQQKEVFSDKPVFDLLTTDISMKHARVGILCER